MWSNMMNGQGWGGMGIGMTGMAVLWILVIILIVVLVSTLAKGALGSGAARERRQEKTALNILQERYAAGEIERDDYEQKKRDLGG